MGRRDNVEEEVVEETPADEVVEESTEEVAQDTSIIDDLADEVTDQEASPVAETTPAPTVDPDAGVTVIDRMTPTEGQTAFSVSKSGFRSYLAFNFGADLEEMTALFGEAIVFDYAKANMIVKAQAITRGNVGKGVSAIAVINDWVPGVKRAAAPIDKKAHANAYVDSAPVEDLEEMLQAILARKAAAV